MVVWNLISIGFGKIVVVWAGLKRGLSWKIRAIVKNAANKQSDATTMLTAKVVLGQNAKP